MGHEFEILATECVQSARIKITRVLAEGSHTRWKNPLIDNGCLVVTGGKRGIRTLGTGKPVRRISNPVHSTTLPSFRVLLIAKEFYVSTSKPPM